MNSTSVTAQSFVGETNYVDGLRSRLALLNATPHRSPECLALFEELREALQSGAIRVAEPAGDIWRVNVWIKHALLASAQAGVLTLQAGPMAGVDLDTTPWRTIPFPGCRIPAGSFIRDGVHLETGVSVMPGTVIQTGAYIGAGSMIDSHATIGTCAQIGQRVNIGCGATVGGVLLPFESLPNIVEDDVVLGYNSGIFDGVRIGSGSIITAGTTISGITSVYDAINQVWLRGDGLTPLTIPPRSIVTMGIPEISTETPPVRTLVPAIVGQRVS